MIWAAILFRIALLFLPPVLSNDWIRYYWDGRIAAHGIDPYQITPEQSGLTENEVGIRMTDNNSYVTLYPPLLITTFEVLSVFSPIVFLWWWKILLLFFSIGTLWIGLRLNGNKVWLSFLPLALLEMAVGVHADVISAFFFALALYQMMKGKELSGGIALGLSAAIKLSPILVLLFWLKDLDRKHWPKLLLGFAIPLVVSYGIAFWRGWNSVGSLIYFVRNWSFGSPWLLLPNFVRVIVAVGLLIAFFPKTDLMTSARRAWIFLWVLSPVVFPWYLLPLGFLFALKPDWFLGIWLNVVLLTYELIPKYVATGEWKPAKWPLVIIAAGWTVGLLLDLMKVTPVNTANRRTHSFGE